MTTRILAMAAAPLLVASMLVQPALAQSNAAKASANVDLPARLKEIESSAPQYEASYRLGAKVAAFCANCHGEGGNSTTPDTPNLAGQNPAYLLEQVRQFADGRRRFEFMEKLIRALTADEKIGVAVYYAAQEVVHKPAANAALAARGKTYYDKICFRCHGEQGRGTAQFARVAGQQPDYLVRTLKRYRDGTGPRTDALMAANTRTMSDADIAAVVAYVNSMK